MERAASEAAPEFPAAVDLGWIGAASSVATSQGPIPAGWLRPGDLVVTRDRALRPVLAIGRLELSWAELSDRPAFWPVSVLPGALGRGRPSAPLTISPWQRLLVEGGALPLPGRSDAFLEARHLIGWPGIECEMPSRGLLAIQIVLAEHELLLAEGQWTESLYLDPETLRGLRGRRPDLLQRLGEGHRRPARPALDDSEAALLRAPAPHPGAEADAVAV